MSPPQTRTNSHRGAALISAILAVALACSAAMVLLGQVDGWIDRVSQQRDKSQALQLARVGVDFARLVLAADALRSGNDSLDEDWARALPPVRQEGVDVSGQIEDLQGRFNLNQLRRTDGLIDEQAHAALRRLLALLALPNGLADALADWIDADDSARAEGAEAAWYQGRRDDMLPGNRPLAHSSTLQRIKGFDIGTVARLQPHITVLPSRQAINLNTANAEVLAAVQPGLSLTSARELIRSRQGASFRDLGDFRNRLPDPNLPAALVPVGTDSQFFFVRIEARSDTSLGRVGAMVERLGDGRRSRLHWISVQ